MSRLEISIWYTPDGGGRRVRQNVLTEQDTTLDRGRIGDVVGLNMEAAMRRALGIPALDRWGKTGGHLTVTTIDGRVIRNAAFRGFHTTPGVGGLRDYARFDYVRKDEPFATISESVRIENIASIVAAAS